MIEKGGTDDSKKEIGDAISNAAKAAWFKVLSNDEFIQGLSKFQEKKEKHIHGNDLERLEDLKNNSNENDFEKAEGYLRKYHIWESIEDILYDFYKTYRNKNNIITISEDMKLKVKWQLKFQIERLIWFIKNDPKQIKDALSNIIFILSEKYSQQIVLDGILAKDAKEQIAQWNNVASFLENHDNYKKIYEDIINDLSKENQMKNIKDIFEKINNNWASYSDKEKKEINLRICYVWDMWLQYNVNKELYSWYYLQSLILRYQKIELKIQ